MADTPNPTAANDLTFRQQFEEQPWGVLTASQAFALYALALYLNEPDFQGLATTSLTDGPEDKKIDFCHIDREAQVAVCGQAYLSETWQRPAAPAAKAADLAAGATWLLGAPILDIPERLRAAASELRQAIDEGEVSRLTFLYVHNCHESDNVRAEMSNVGRTAAALLEGRNIDVRVEELGVESLEALFEELDREILVQDEIRIPLSGRYEVEGERWRSVVTSVPGGVLHELGTKYGDRLYSANIRGFLGILRRRGNINQVIHSTVASEPDNFWAFNNGITLLTNNIRFEGDELIVAGLSVINGAQTTGVLRESAEDDVKAVEVPCRFIECDDDDLIRKIIQYNNTQNEIKSFDLRSTDAVQRRIAKEFKEYGIEYIHRREATRRPAAGAIRADVIGQALCSFHGDLQTAIRRRSSIFEDDAKYQEVFPSTLTAEHVYLVQCLVSALDEVKARLRARVTEELATELEQTRSALMEFSTTKQFLLFVVGRIASQILGQALPELFVWRCRSNLVKSDRSDIASLWVDVVERLLPKIARLVGDEPGVAVRSTEDARRLSDELADHLEAFGEDYRNVLDRLRDATAY